MSIRDVTKVLHFWMDNGQPSENRGWISAALIAEARRPVATFPGSNEGVGLAWTIASHREHPTMTHVGSTLGHMSSVWVAPEQGLGYAVLANSRRAGRVLHHTIERLECDVLGKPPERFATPSEHILDGASLDRAAGQYVNPGELAITLNPEGQHLHVTMSVLDPLLLDVEPSVELGSPAPLIFSTSVRFRLGNAYGPPGILQLGSSPRPEGLFLFDRFYRRLSSSA
jgi:hypothetical protein